MRNILIPILSIFVTRFISYFYYTLYVNAHVSYQIYQMPGAYNIGVFKSKWILVLRQPCVTYIQKKSMPYASLACKLVNIFPRVR